MPNQEATPRRTFRSPDEIWEPAKRVAEERGETLTDVLNRALVIYARTYGHGLILSAGPVAPTSPADTDDEAED